MSDPAVDMIIAAIHAAAPAEDMQTKLVGIDGGGGAGKSTLATKLAPRLAAPVIHTDEFARPECPLDWYKRLKTQVIEPLRRNASARFQRYDWQTQQLAEWRTIPAGGTVILEGVSATRMAFREALAFCIYVDTPRTVRLERGLMRDGQAALPLWQQWQSEEDCYFAAENPRAHADIIVDGTT